ncbi:MAG: nuclear transport factor 2 family protein [Planctomycetota bacterium]
MHPTPKLQNALNLYLHGIRDGHIHDAIHDFTGARYTQHSTGVADGREGFLAFFGPFLERWTKRDIRVVRAIEDGRYVFCQVSQDLNEGEARWVTTDMFDTDEDDKIVEHWDVISPWAAARGDGRSQLGGPTEVRDLDRTQANKELVDAFFERVLLGGAHEEMGDFVAEDLVQHDLAVADGRQAWVDDLAAREVHYGNLFRLLGQGNFVVTYCEVDVGGEAQAVFDLFRLEDGIIVERWVNAEVIPADTGNSGKF